MHSVQSVGCGDCHPYHVLSQYDKYRDKALSSCNNMVCKYGLDWQVFCSLSTGIAQNIMILFGSQLSQVR